MCVNKVCNFHYYERAKLPGELNPVELVHCTDFTRYFNLKETTCKPSIMHPPPHLLCFFAIDSKNLRHPIPEMPDFYHIFVADAPMKK